MNVFRSDAIGLDTNDFLLPQFFKTSDISDGIT